MKIKDEAQPKIEEIIGWDTVNWSKALDFWEKHSNVNSNKLTSLELGCNLGGISLWLSKKGHQVVCSDLEDPREKCLPLHRKYHASNIEYQPINATDIPFKDHFDIVIFKSILGGISRNKQDELKEKVIDEIYKSLKPGGYVLFAENLEASFLHKFFRQLFIKWGNQWNYLKVSKISKLFSKFDQLKFTTSGFFGAFGRTEPQRKLLGKIDSKLAPIIPIKTRYIAMGVARKPNEKTK